MPRLDGAGICCYPRRATGTPAVAPSGSDSEKMFRVLCLGYSVTEQPGYVERAEALAAAEGREIALVKSGWGGHSLPTLAYLIDEILDALPCDLVLLEVFTGGVRHYGAAGMRLYLDEILAAIARRGLPVALLDLYQGGVDYDDEPAAGLVEEYHALYGIPRLDIAAAVWAAGGQDNAFLLTDGTHVTPAGGDLYGTLVYAFLRDPPVRRDYVGHFAGLPRRFASLPLRTLGLACPFELRRHGIPLHFSEVAEGTEAEIDLGSRRRVLGAMVTYGPRSGRMRFHDGSVGCAVLAHDAFSYYTRAFLLPVWFGSARRLRVAQLAGLPEVTLRKGEADRGPRLGRVSHVFCARVLRLDERAALARHRLTRVLRAWRLRLRRLRPRRPAPADARIVAR